MMESGSHEVSEAFGDFHTSSVDVEAPSSLGDVLPVAESVAPPPELLERLHKLEEVQEQIPKATPLNITEEQKKIRRQRCLVCISVVTVAAIIAIVLGMLLGMNNDNEKDDNTESATFILLKDMVTSVWPDSSDSVSDQSSPKYAALEWLEGNAYLNDYPEWKRIQRYVLAVLYYSTNGDSWQRNDKWMSDEDECLWASAASDPLWASAAVNPVCNNETGFLRLDLRANNLVGTIPLELGRGLSNSLEIVFLSDDEIAGTIPTELGMLSNLDRPCTYVLSQLGFDSILQLIFI
jgi:hypothetical protein